MPRPIACHLVGERTSPEPKFIAVWEKGSRLKWILWTEQTLMVSVLWLRAVSSIRIYRKAIPPVIPALLES